ncbi:MAG: hypothetical protein EOO23_05515 [Comamonadaceae bacterium]|nr:MAG: hypothetical protein EOO23_05515 [Comamonadaceae bacterium]
MESNKLSNLAPRNPLEVVAIFISFIYGVSTLFLGLSAHNLSKENQTYMVAFVTLFPVAILAMFGWLVSRHHTKLYAPGDYRSDDAFHGVSAPPGALGGKLNQEELAQAEAPQKLEAGSVQAEVVPEGRAEQLLPVDHGEAAANSGGLPPQIISSRSSAAAKSIAGAYLAESLAFQELQGEFNASVRRHIQLVAPNGKVFNVDGVLEAPGQISPVEVKYIRTQGAIRTLISSGFANLDGIETVYIGSREKVKPILALVVSDGSLIMKIVREIGRQKDYANSDIIVKIFEFDSLVGKYGLLGSNVD